MLIKGDFCHSDYVINSFNQSIKGLSSCDVCLIILEFLDDQELKDLTEFVKERNP
jgi:indole-3-glycerol phosphate synthase